MSYDLFFLESDRWGDDDFLEFFEGRPNYEIAGMLVSYRNEDTDVYFTFELHDRGLDLEFERDHPCCWVLFSLNFNRPSFFAVEAALEIEAFICHFESQIYDPQIDGPPGDPFSIEAFIREWNRGNELASRTINSLKTQPDYFLKPRADLKAIWEWNYSIDRRYEDMVEDLFIPRISFCRDSDEAKTAIVWGDLVPSILPKVEWVIIVKDRYARRRWFRKEVEIAIVPWESMPDELSGYRTEIQPVPHYFVDKPEPPKEWVDWIRRIPAGNRPEILSMHQILDAESFQV